MPHLSHSRTTVAISIAFITFGIIILIRQMGLLQMLEMGVYDAHLKLQTKSGNSTYPLVLLTINEADLQRFGYPISDGILATALEQLTVLEATAIGIDFFRDLKSEGREQLANISQVNPSIVFIEKVLGNPVSAPEFVTHSTQKSFADLKQDTNGVIRRGLLMLWDEKDNAQFSLSLQLVLTYLESQGIVLTADPKDPDQVKLGETVITRFSSNDGGYRNVDDGGYQYLMNYDNGTHGFTQFSLSQLMDGKVSSEMIKNALVLVGLTATSVRDLHETPFSSGWAKSTPTYGIEIHAHLVNQLLSGVKHNTPPISVLPWLLDYVLLLVATLLAAISAVIYEQKNIQLALVLMASTVGLLSAAQFSFNQGLWLTIVPPVLGLLLATALTAAYLAQRERKSMGQMMKLFGQYVSPEVADVLWAQRDEIFENGKPKPQRLTATVMITDLQGFVSTTQDMDPADLMDWLNHYLDAMTKLAIHHGGFVDDYAGDGIKINFGVPLARTRQKEIAEDATAAVTCALAMSEQVKLINLESRTNGRPEYKLRVGISTGTVIAGSIGSTERMKYTTVGDMVNTAARLESFEKENCSFSSTNTARILITQETRNQLNGSFTIESLGDCLIPGKNKDVPIFCVTGENSLYSTDHGGNHV